jgi:hypothetical protein
MASRSVARTNRRTGTRKNGEVSNQLLDPLSEIPQPNASLGSEPDDAPDQDRAPALTA